MIKLVLYAYYLRGLHSALILCHTPELLTHWQTIFISRLDPVPYNHRPRVVGVPSL